MKAAVDRGYTLQQAYGEQGAQISRSGGNGGSSVGGVSSGGYNQYETNGASMDAYDVSSRLGAGENCVAQRRSRCGEAMTLQNMYMEGRPIMNNLIESRGRSNNQLLPQQSIYREPPYTSSRHGTPQKLNEPRNYFERAFRIQDPHDTPATLGIAPQQTRNTGSILRIDALEPALFKPPKSQVLQDALRTRPQPRMAEVYGAQSVAGEQLCRANEQSKLYSGSGALNGYNPLLCNQSDGYSTGAVIQPRSGGYHPRARFGVPLPYKRGNIMYGRPGGPRSLTQKLPALMHIRGNSNWRTREYTREPMPYNRGRAGFGMRPECVVMRPVCRGNRYLWAGAPNASTHRRQVMRPRNMNIRPKNRVDAAYTGPRHREGRGTFAGSNTNYLTGRADPCRIVKELGKGRPGGPIWALDGVADALHPKRMTDAVMRSTHNKATGMLSMDKRPPVPTRTDTMQYRQDWPCNRVRKVSKEIRREVDPTMLAAYKSNPYAQPIMN